MARQHKITRKREIELASRRVVESGELAAAGISAESAGDQKKFDDEWDKLKPGESITQKE